MTRNYFKPVLGSILGIGLLATGLVANASTPWKEVLPQEDNAHPTRAAQHAASPKVKSMRPIRATGNPENTVNPGLEGLRTLPSALRQRKVKPAPIMKSAEEPRGNLYGVVNRFVGMELVYEAYLGELNTATGRLTPKFTGAQYCPYNGDDYVYQSNGYRKGEIICTRRETREEGAISHYAVWTTYDINTGDYIATHTFTDYLATGYSMTYDPDLDLFYVISLDGVGSEGFSVFGIIKPNDNGKWEYYYGGKLETTDGQKPYIAAIAYNPSDKQVYAFDNQDYVYSIEWGSDYKNPDNIIISAGEVYMQNGAYLFECDSNDPINGQICYSPMDECFIAVFRDNGRQQNYLAFVHPETFEVVLGEQIKARESCFVNAIFCVDDMASSDAPMLAAQPVVKFDKASNSGQITLSVPSESFIGVNISDETLKAVTKVDDKIVDERDVKAGSTFNVNLTLEQGEHKLVYYTSRNGEESPKNTVMFYVGYDAPAPVKDITLNGQTLSWSAPNEIGYHGGYVDTADITYNVYLNNKIQNNEPIKATSFTLNAPENMSVYNLAVEAVSQGQKSPLASIDKIFGKAFELPFLQSPTQSQSHIYTIIDANNDGWKFYWGTQNVNEQSFDVMTFLPGYMRDADDWLILPLINFPDASKLYTFNFEMRGYYTTRMTNESYAIYLLKSPDADPKSVVTTIYTTPEEAMMATMPMQKAFTFAVPEAGEYYLAIKALSTRDQNSAGFTVHNIEVKDLSGASAAVPGNPTDVKVIAGERGAQEASVTATLPLNDILGNPLPADDDITLTFSFITSSGSERVTSGTGKPGQTITVKNGADNDGYIVYTVTPSNKNGKGYSKSYRIYVGLDIPLHPDNIRGVPTDNNMGIVVEWDAPGNVGRNGGYVDLEDTDFTYTFYTQHGGSNQNLQKIDDTRELTYTFYPYGDDTKGTLATFYMGPAARNSVGQSIESMFLREDLGTPYELPLNEEWATSKFAYSPYTFFTSGEYAGTYWENTGNVGNLPLGNPQIIQGALLGFAEYRSSKSKLVLPKFTTMGIKKSIFKIRVWDYKGAPAEIRIIGRHNGFANGEEKLIDKFVLDRPDTGEWKDIELTLPAEYNDCGWVQMLVECPMTAADNEYILIDSFQMIDDADYDLKITDFDGMSEASLGDDIVYNVTVANSGRERMSGNLKVEVVGEGGKVLDLVQAPVDMLASNQTAEFTADFHISYNEPKVIVRATVEADEDQNAANNSKEIELAIKPSAIPVVDDLTADADHDTNTVKLSWSTPSTTYGNFENFEAYKPFALTETFDYWTNINADDLWPMAFQNEMTGDVAQWENSNEKRGWQIYEYDKLGFSNDRIRPHSGKQALMAVCGGYDEGEEPVQTSKWLVSPLLVPNTTVSFWYTTFESSVTEYVEIWTCEKEDGELNPYDKNIRAGRAGDFRKISSKSKLGAEDWEFIKYQLGRREVKFALRYCSYDGFAAAIDDISFTPANMLTRTAESYSLYRCDKNGNNPVLVADGITDTNYTDNTWDGEECMYYVVANCTVDNAVVAGPTSNRVLIAASGVDGISDAQSVIAGKGTIEVNGFAGQLVSIAAADGKIIVNAPAKSNNAVYNADKGVYLVTIGKRTFKVIVK